MREVNREDAISDLMMQIPLAMNECPRHKRFAIERYMRTFLRSLTLYELQSALEYYDTNRELYPDVAYKVAQAAEGYDYFMAKRGWI